LVTRNSHEKSTQQDWGAFDKIAPMSETAIPPQTLCEFLQQSGAQVHVFDMGRRLVEIPTEQMLAIECQQAPYPQPFQRSAMLGVLFYYQNKAGNSTEQQIWFLKFPLDEQGLLSLEARDDFLRRIIEQLAEQTLAKREAGKNPQAPAMVGDNPHGFTPRDDRMASFHAKVAKRLGQPPSRFYAHARDYFSGTPGFDQWNFVGLQGIADVAARLDEDNNLATIITAIPQLPATPLAALCSCLENEIIDPALGSVLGIRLEHALQEGDAATVAAVLRGLSHGSDQTLLHKAIHSTLDSETGNNVEVLASIAGRAWQALAHSDTHHRAFLQRLALCEAGQGAFDNIMADLMFLPCLRRPLLNSLRHLRDRGECTAQQAMIIDNFFQSLQTTD